jgi:hypothetical protein
MQPSHIRRPASRRGIIAVGFELLLGSVNIAATGGTAWFMWRAHKEVPRAEAALQKSGYTMDVTKLAAATAPDEDNAGAIAPLLGLSTRDQDETPEIKERRIRLNQLSMKLPAAPADAGAKAAAAKFAAGGKLDLNELRKLPARKQQPEISPDRHIDWSAWVAWFQELGWHTPSTELKDAGVVYRTLALQTDFLTGPLREAAGRKHARLTPSQQSRFTASIARMDIVLDMDLGKSRFIPALRALSLQMEAALAAGLEKEAVELVPVVFRLRDITSSDVTLIDLLVRVTVDSMLMDALKRNLLAGTASAPFLSAMQQHLAARPMLEGMEQILNMEAAYVCYMLEQVATQRVSLDAFSSMLGDINAHRGQRQWVVEPLARSLLALNRAERIRMFLEDMEGWKAGGPMGYYRVAKAREARIASRSDWTAIMRLDRMIGESAASGYSALIPKLLHRDMRHRMAIVACALERHRLATDSVPENLAGLPKDLLPEIPADLDGQAIRYRRHADGWVLWSVGMDLKDDLRGEAPAPDEMDDQQRADWQWRNRSSEWK